MLLSSEIPDSVLDGLSDLKTMLSDQIYSTAVYGKINMKRMNNKIFWFAPQIDSLVEF